jgi:hypothetical protein
MRKMIFVIYMLFIKKIPIYRDVFCKFILNALGKKHINHRLIGNYQYNYCYLVGSHSVVCD